jgi:hypothetical protein
MMVLGGEQNNLLLKMKTDSMKFSIESMLSPILLAVLTMITPTALVSVFALLGSITFIILNLSRIKFEIVDKECGGSWLIYFKKLFNFRKK